MQLDAQSKDIIKFLYSAHIENVTPKSVMYGNGVVQTQYPVIGSDYKSEIDIRFHLINAKHKNNADLKFILQNLISEGLIESTKGGLLERRYRLTPKGYTVYKKRKKFPIPYNLLMLLIGIAGLILAYISIRVTLGKSFNPFND